MKYDFDEIIVRKGTDCVKYDGVAEMWGRDDLLPMWVADMDFRTPPFVIDAIRQRLDQDVLGYTLPCESWYENIIRWVGKRHNVQVQKEEIGFVPGIVRGIAFAVNCFTNPGEKVMVQTPVYHPFFLVTEHNHREVVYNSLDIHDGQVHINFDRFERDIQGCKLFILCNPQNPGGRVWTLEELQRVADICQRNGVMVISDEIHADLTLPGYKHHSYATVSEAARQHSIIFMAPSKAFNMPGLSSSYSLIFNKDKRDRFNTYMEASELSMGNMFAYLSCAAAYEQGEDWLNQMLSYVQGNIDFTEQYLRAHIPSISMLKPQASYLVFLDCRKLNLSQEQLVDLFVDKAHLALNDGTMFGPEGKGFMRLNVGCPRSILQQALTQLEQAIK
ncbi:MAG: pyridoxal phosphate-dependent aminotransferase [Bacteroidaceae bacterium]|nr:pyridoxal phosphate-dependent aminotransferase [Bacteroidaceae bacterium]